MSVLSFGIKVAMADIWYKKESGRGRGNDSAQEIVESIMIILDLLTAMMI